MKTIFVHGSGQRSNSWDKVLSEIEYKNECLTPDLRDILKGKPATYKNLYGAFKSYCDQFEEKINIVGLSLGGILALEYVMENPERVQKLMLIATPHKVPKLVFTIQNIVLRFLPSSLFKDMAFNKEDTLALGKSMKDLNFTNRVSKLKNETCVVCGQKDKTNLKSAYYLKEHIKSAKLIIVEGAGHVLNEEVPEKLAGVINGFFE